MSLSKERTDALAVELRPLSHEAKQRLLECAVLEVYARLGVPLSDEAEELFQSEVSVLYRSFLVARRSASSWFLWQARLIAETNRRCDAAAQGRPAA
jgi:hypothetical protein